MKGIGELEGKGGVIHLLVPCRIHNLGFVWGLGGCVCVCVNFTLYITWNPIRKQPSDTANPVFLSMLFLKLKHTTYFDLHRSTIKIPSSK